MKAQELTAYTDFQKQRSKAKNNANNAPNLMPLGFGRLLKREIKKVGVSCNKYDVKNLLNQLQGKCLERTTVSIGCCNLVLVHSTRSLLFGFRSILVEKITFIILNCLRNNQIRNHLAGLFSFLFLA